MTRRLQIVVLGSLVGALILAAAARASCIPATEAEQRARADVIFEGVAVEGPTPSGRQQFRVDRYLKGSGAKLVAVATGVTRNADGSGSLTSVSVSVAAGERWRIFGRVIEGAVETSICAGSTRLVGREGTSVGQPSISSDRGAMVAATAVLIVALGVAVMVTRRRRPRRVMGR
jgi:hypothetical protein